MAVTRVEELVTEACIPERREFWVLCDSPDDTAVDVLLAEEIPCVVGEPLHDDPYYVCRRLTVKPGGEYSPWWITVVKFLGCTVAPRWQWYVKADNRVDYTSKPEALTSVVDWVGI